MISLLFFWFTSLSWADAIDIPLTNCPAGSKLTSSHAGTWCEPQICEVRTSTCKASEICSEYALCVTETQIPCGGRAYNDPNCFVTKKEAFGPCDTDETCQQGSCETALRCTPKPEKQKTKNNTQTKNPTSSCAGCNTSPPITAMGLILLFPFVFVRRK